MGNVNCRRRGFHHRAGYSNAPFQGRSNDIESDMADVDMAEPAPKLIAATKMGSKARLKLAGWRNKGGFETKVREEAPVANVAEIPVVVEATPASGSGRSCKCQVSGFVNF